MQGISLYKKQVKQGAPLYHTFHKENGKYLEREREAEKFLVLGQVDDCDPSSFYDIQSLNALIEDLDIVILEADISGDTEASTHLKEILVLCRFCLWNIGEYVLHMSPYEILSTESYPTSLSEKYKFNISLAGL